MEFFDLGLKGGQQLAARFQEHQAFFLVGDFSFPMVERADLRDQVRAGDQALVEQVPGDPGALAGVAAGDEDYNFVGH